MWIFLNDAMLSIVQHQDDPRLVVVRARIKGDLQRAFAGRLKGHRVLRTPHADYLYRVTLPRDVVAAAQRAWLEAVTYDNFKNSVADHGRHDAYLRVWSVMNSEQLRREPRV